MGTITDFATMQMFQNIIDDELSDRHSTGSMPAPKASYIDKKYDSKAVFKKKKVAKHIGDSGIHDSEDDWLSRQLKEEAAVLKKLKM